MSVQLRLFPESWVAEAAAGRSSSTGTIRGNTPSLQSPSDGQTKRSISPGLNCTHFAHLLFRNIVDELSEKKLRSLYHGSSFLSVKKTRPAPEVSMNFPRRGYWQPNLPSRQYSLQTIAVDLSAAVINSHDVVVRFTTNRIAHS